MLDDRASKNNNYNVSVTLEGWVGFLLYPALSANQNIEISGNRSINGQIIAFGNQNVNTSLVEGPDSGPNRSTITGSFELTLNDGNSVGRISLYSWRQIKR